MKQPPIHPETPRSRLAGRRRCRGAPRRAVATLVVLLLVSIALALSYASMRWQATAVEIQHNADLATDARQAAVTGLTMALKKMQTADWAGVDTTLSGSLGPQQGYDVTYTVGDPSLAPGDPEYAEWPYRVTLLSVGYAADPSQPGRATTHQARAVVRLVPRKLADEPSDWGAMQAYTVYQTNKDSFAMDIPCRIAGPVRVQGKLELAKHYPSDAGAWSTYLSDLNAMRKAGRTDDRPLTGPVYFPYSRQDPKVHDALRSSLAVATVDLPGNEAASDWVEPTGLTEYRIYQGGPVYPVPWVASTLRDETLGPDPLTNPLGLYYGNGDVDLRDNVTIRGTLFCRYDIRVVGSNVHFEPVDMPSLHGSDRPVRLPVATCQKFKVKPTAGGSLTGLVAVFDKFTIEKSPETVTFAITGKVVAKKFFIKERQPWDTLNWGSQYKDFEAYLKKIAPATAFFPIWMGDRGRDPQPRLTLTPDPAPVTYHWQNRYNPVYVPHPGDVTKLDPYHPALRWELVAWTDNP